MTQFETLTLDERLNIAVKMTAIAIGMERGDAAMLEWLQSDKPEHLKRDLTTEPNGWK